MAIQNRKDVLERTRLSWNRTYNECSSLLEELAAKEIEAFSEDNYAEAFILQFSFIETRIESSTQYFGEKLRLHPTSLKALRDETSVAKKITYFDLILSSFIATGSKGDFQSLVGKLREYNAFRNDFLHHCANRRKFRSALHIEQAVEEAYTEGVEIIRLFVKVKLKKTDQNNRRGFNQ